MKTISFSPEEEKELLSILPQKYKDRINNAYSFYIPDNNIFISPGLPDSFDKLPNNLNIGKEIKVVKNSSCIGMSGIIRRHYVNSYDCGDRGEAYYEFHAYGNSGIYSTRVENCELLN